MVKAAVLTVSDGVSQGWREDTSGLLAVKILRDDLGIQDLVAEVVPDDRAAIEDTLRRWSDTERCQVIITSGGTGISPRDVTPQATQAVIEYEVPGLAELMRAESLRKTPMAALSRAIAGVRGRTLIINLPGSPKGVQECLDVILPILPHALEQLESGAGH
ncbi:MAG TPA: MogA/MoaB family molybdenum cofactor biosynthesis protein [Chloroflexia bacterium]|nr:MogA/MoaB family molybdenum cofactor biosynthesis protein [Chloroflexia bacterium]